MNQFEMKAKTRKFAVDVWRLCKNLPHTSEFNSIAGQLIRASTSAAANYHASCRGKSRADFINKLKIVEEEADESQFFLEFILEVHNDNLIQSELEKLIFEADTILAINCCKH